MRTAKPGGSEPEANWHDQGKVHLSPTSLPNRPGQPFHRSAARRQGWPSITPRRKAHVAIRAATRRQTRPLDQAEHDGLVNVAYSPAGQETKRRGRACASWLSRVDPVPSLRLFITTHSGDGGGEGGGDGGGEGGGDGGGEGGGGGQGSHRRGWAELARVFEEPCSRVKFCLSRERDLMALDRGSRVAEELFDGEVYWPPPSAE